MTTPDPQAIPLVDGLRTLTESWSGPNPRPEQARYRTLAVGMGSHRGGRRMAAVRLALGMLIGLSLIAAANNGLMIPFTGITIGGLAGEPAGSPIGAGRASLFPMSARPCVIRDPRSCAASHTGIGVPAGEAPGSKAGGRAISPARSANPTPPGTRAGTAGATNPTDPLQSQGAGDGDATGGGRNHRKPDPGPGV